jgi:peroxiredoxin Q/BCP
MARIPAFSLPCTEGGMLSRTDLDGRAYVLFCYPKDLTPGCTTESCDFRDHLARIQAQGVVVYGLSADSLARHERFITKHGLTFPLISDEQSVLLTKLGVWKEKSMYGKTFMGIERSTFLVGPDHTILRDWRKVKVAGHVAEVVAAIEDEQLHQS